MNKGKDIASSGRKLGYALQPFYPFPTNLSNITVKPTPFSDRADGFIDSYDFRPFDYGVKVFANADATENEKLTIEDILRFGTNVINVWGESKKSDTEKKQLELQIKQRDEELQRKKEEANASLRKTIIITSSIIGGVVIVSSLIWFASRKK